MHKECTILIIDDNTTNLGVAVDFLEREGFGIMVAKNGKNGVEKAQLGQPDIILLDVMMPGIDGFETCRRLKAKEATEDIPVIFITSLNDEEDKIKGFEAGAVDYVTKPIQQGDREKCLAAGANDYLAKPIDPDRLLSMLRVWLYR